MRAMIAKELGEHGPAFLIYTVLQSLLFLVFLYLAHLNPGRGTYLLAFRSYLVLGASLGAFWLAHRLVTREYSGRTQLFLEALPVGRGSIFAAKWLVGFTIFMIPTLFGLVVSLLAMWSDEVVTTLFVQLIVTRSSAFLLFVFCYAFTVGFLGRYRILAVILTVVALSVLEDKTQYDSIAMGPLSLVLDDRFLYERNVWPVDDITQALIGSLVLLVIALMMMFTREGSVAAMMARKMSHREKVFLFSMTLVFIFVLYIFEEAAEEKPYKLMDAVVARGNGTMVSIGLTSKDGEQELQELADELRDELEEMRRFLDLDQLSPVFLTLREDLDPGVYEQGNLSGASGFLARLEYDPEQFDKRRFMAWLTPRILRETTDGRVDLEPNRWLLDGFALYFAYRDLPEEEFRFLILRALYGAPKELTRRHLDQWLVFRERVGGEIAKGLAWHGLRHFEEKAGEVEFRKLMGTKLGLTLPRSVRAVWYEIQHPLAGEIKNTTGMDYESFVQSWNDILEEDRRRYENELAAVPKLTGRLQTIDLSELTRRLEFKLNPPDKALEERVHFRYMKLYAYDHEMDETDYSGEELPFETATSQWNTLPGTYSRGSRLAWTFALDSALLECEIISGWTRMEVP